MKELVLPRESARESVGRTVKASSEIKPVGGEGVVRLMVSCLTARERLNFGPILGKHRLKMDIFDLVNLNSYGLGEGGGGILTCTGIYQNERAGLMKLFHLP